MLLLLNKNLQNLAVIVKMFQLIKFFIESSKYTLTSILNLTFFNISGKRNWFDSKQGSQTGRSRRSLRLESIDWNRESRYSDSWRRKRTGNRGRRLGDFAGFRKMAERSQGEHLAEVPGQDAAGLFRILGFLCFPQSIQSSWSFPWNCWTQTRRTLRPDAWLTGLCLFFGCENPDFDVTSLKPLILVICKHHKMF